MNLFQPGIEPVGCAPSTSGGICRPRHVENRFIVKGGDGTNLTCRALHGQLTERFEPGSTARPRGHGPALLRPRVERTLSDHPEVSPLIAALHVVGEHVGAVLDRPELGDPLTTTFSTFTEPRPAPRSTTRPHGLGRHLGTMSTLPDPR
ncbi:hypothetical protein GCM10012284_21950 [Mangrovihabitans endophyticus]|uniref:Uncharacterized protein n=1 Tax=Mangrovihabitans endophyticus TaxID=1751298 RepID=A0A8J3FNI3_9ACTN|nr:hypothetical protein GCM10012284_21950 [Mangrovihabitans endophyticus]